MISGPFMLLKYILKCFHKGGYLKKPFLAQRIMRERSVKTEI